MQNNITVPFKLVAVFIVLTVITVAVFALTQPTIAGS